MTYAGDFMHLSREGLAAGAMDAMRQLMSGIGLTVNEEKTRPVQLPHEAFDFLARIQVSVASSALGYRYFAQTGCRSARRTHLCVVADLSATAAVHEAMVRATPATGHRFLAFPLVLGYEGAGIVQKVGARGLRTSSRAILDGRCCWSDNVFVEQVWRSIQCEEVCAESVRFWMSPILTFSIDEFFNVIMRTSVFVLTGCRLTTLLKSGVQMRLLSYLLSSPPVRWACGRRTVRPRLYGST